MRKRSGLSTGTLQTRADGHGEAMMSRCSEAVRPCRMVPQEPCRQKQKNDEAKMSRSFEAVRPCKGFFQM